jgi:hypothetical protein
MSGSRKSRDLEYALHIASCRKIGLDERLHSWEEIAGWKISFAGAVANEYVPRVAQDPPTFLGNRGRIRKMMKDHRHENHIDTVVLDGKALC